MLSPHILFSMDASSKSLTIHHFFFVLGLLAVHLAPALAGKWHYCKQLIVYDVTHI